MENRIKLDQNMKDEARSRIRHKMAHETEVLIAAELNDLEGRNIRVTNMKALVLDLSAAAFLGVMEGCNAVKETREL